MTKYNNNILGTE